jgi:2-oxoisovalerate dehydrogenase E2 component (dihydrolipoyl transacylase)
MAIKEFKLPDPGEGLTEAEVVTWRVQPGDTVKVNDVVVEVETAKSLVELPVPFAGRVSRLLVEEGDTVAVGTPIIAVDTEPEGPAEPPPAAEPSPPARAARQPTGQSPQEGETPATSTGRTPVLVGYGVRQTEARRRPRRQEPPAAAARPTSPPAARGPVLAKPPVRKLAKDLGIELEQVAPSGDGGVVTRADVEAFAATGGAPAYRPVAATGERESRIPVTGVRKLTAAAMVGSAFTAPHVTEWVTVDVSRTMELVERLREDREFEGLKVTPLLVLAKAACLAVRRNPGVNAAWDEESQEIVLKHYVNLGIAAATPRGLLVPNVKDADRMSMRELAEAIAALTATAREGRSQPPDMAGGTITITNVGVFGVDSGTPIINPGESAILAFGAVRRMPWVVTAADGTEAIEPRWVTQLALSFDHRLVDGELGSRYLADVAEILHDPARGLVWG